MRTNELKLNPEKMEVLMVVPYSWSDDGSGLVLDGVTLHQNGQVCSLGMLLDTGLLLR